MDIAYSFAGLSVGFIVGLTGVGGGSLMTPLLVLLFGFSPSVAVGTDLLYASITKAGGTVVHGLKHTIEWKIVGWLALGSIPASLLVVSLLSGRKTFNASQEQIFSISLGIMLLMTAFSLVFRQSIQAWAERRSEGKAPTRLKLFYTVLVGIFLGTAVSLSSVGAGAVGVTALVLLYPKLSAAKIVGTDIVHAVPLTLVAGLGHASLGHVDWSLLASLLVGSLPGVALGSILSTRLPDAYVRHSLVVLLAIIGGRLVFIR
jgi:uncharacterized protein